MTTNQLPWKKYHPLSDQNAFICLVEHMGDDSSIVQAARVSYGKDDRNGEGRCKHLAICRDGYTINKKGNYVCTECKTEYNTGWVPIKDRNLIRYLMNHQHTTPFEMVEFKFMVQVPMDCWRQWIRHRTASVNEYSTRYTEALDFFQVTSPQEWRLQATDNKQGSSGYLPASYLVDEERVVKDVLSDGQALTRFEEDFHTHAKNVYKTRLAAGVAKEQARKDLPLSTYTRAYWKCDLHNIFNFLRLRMDSHAQLEIRSFANCMFEIIKQVCPVACEAFEDYVLHAKKFSRMEMELLRRIFSDHKDTYEGTDKEITKSNSLTDREWKEFLEKVTS